MTGGRLGPRLSTPVTGVIFDLGGTLVCNHPENESDRERRQCAAIARVVGDGLDGPGRQALADRLFALRNEDGALAEQDLFERRARVTIARALREHAVPTDEGVIDRAERLLFEPDRRDRRLYPGTRELLDTLRTRGLRIGLISNWSSHWVVTDLTLALGIQEYFQPLVSSCQFGRLKPHPSVFRHVLESWHLEPQDAVMVGDTLSTDIAGARAAGMPSILVEMEPNPANAALVDSVHPNHRVARLAEIPPLLGLVDS